MVSLIFYGVIAAFLLGGGALVYHSIGSAAVAKQEAAQKVEQDKIQAVSKAKTEATESALVKMQEAFDAGRAQREVVTKTVYVKGQDYIRNVPVSKDCVVPPEGMDLLNRARAQAAANILGLSEDPVTISPKVIVVPMPAPAPGPAAGVPTRPPKPVPVK